jgi:hypothetical protein
MESVEETEFSKFEIEALPSTSAEMLLDVDVYSSDLEDVTTLSFETGSNWSHRLRGPPA